MKFVSSLFLLFEVFALLTLKNSSFAKATLVRDQENRLEGIQLNRKSQDSPGFDIKVELSRGDYSLPKRMLLSLTNSQIIFAEESCGNILFSSFNCHNANCPSEKSLPVMIEHPYFSAIGRPLNITLEIESCWFPNNSSSGLPIPPWKLDTEALLAFDCKKDKNYYPFYQYSRHGIIGMGTEGSQNLSRIFSLDVRFWNHGYMLFGFNPNLTKPISPIVFPVDSRWQISSKQGSLTFGNHSIPLSGKVLFDINFDDIKLPRNVWNSLFQIFNQSYGPCYQGNPFGFNCSEKMDVTKIPPLRLVLDDKIIELPHQVFSDFFFTDSSDLHFTPLNTSSMENVYGVSVNAKSLFNDTIILGARFMTYYHAVFKSDQGSNSIEIYQRRWNYIPTKKPKSKQAEKPEQSRNIGEIAGPVFGIGALICICFLCCYSMKSEDGSLLKQSDQSLGNEGQLLQGEQTNLLLKSPKRESEIVL